MDAPAAPSSPVVRAAATYGGVLRDLIKRLKYDGELDVAPMLAELIVEHLERHYDATSIDLIVANPTHVARGIRHTEAILTAAAVRADRRWRFDDVARPCLVKTRPTPQSHGGSRRARQAAADALHGALTVARPELVTGRRILVIDDVAATGAQLQAVAAKLMEHGARSVAGLVVASPPRGRGTELVGRDPSHGPPRRAGGSQAAGEDTGDVTPASERPLAIAKNDLAGRLDRIQSAQRTHPGGLGR